MHLRDYLRVDDARAPGQEGGKNCYAPSDCGAFHSALPGRRNFAMVGTDCAYRITSFAWNNSSCGIVSPSALAVFRLMTNSKSLGCSIASSAGFAPFRIRST